MAVITTTSVPSKALVNSPFSSIASSSVSSIKSFSQCDGVAAARYARFKGIWTITEMDSSPWRPGGWGFTSIILGIRHILPSEAELNWLQYYSRFFYFLGVPAVSNSLLSRRRISPAQLRGPVESNDRPGINSLWASNVQAAFAQIAPAPSPNHKAHR